MFVNSPLGTFTVRSCWETRNQPEDVNSPLLKTSVNEFYGVGIGHLSAAGDLQWLCSSRKSWPRHGSWEHIWLVQPPLWHPQVKLHPASATHPTAPPIYLTTSPQPPSTTQVAPASPTQIGKRHLRPSCCAAYKTDVCLKYGSIFYLSAPPPWQVSSMPLFGPVYAYILPLSAYQQETVCFSHH